MKNNGSEEEVVSPAVGSGNIMRQLQEVDSKGVERKREVVIRPDGSKMIRVEKRRRTYDDSARSEKNSGLKNKRLLIALCIFILMVSAGLTGGYLYRLASFNTEEYSSRLQGELAAAWGAEVEITGVVMDGRVLKAARIQASFPAESCLAFVCLEGISGEISATALLMGKVKGESLNVNRTVIGVRPGYAKFTLPQTGKALPFVFQRYTGPRFEVGYAHETEPFALNKNDSPFYLSAEAYIRTTMVGTEVEYVLDLSEQKLKIQGWPLMFMDAGSIILDGQGIRQLTFSGRLDKGALSQNPKEVSPCMITGGFRLGGDFRSRVWNLTGRNFPLEQLIGDGLASILKARIGEPQVEEKREMNLSFALPVGAEQKRPAMKGSSGSVIQATMQRLPVLNLLFHMTERKADHGVTYNSPVFTSGSFFIESDGTDQTISLTQLSLFEQNFLGVDGALYVKGGELSGQLVFKLPAYMVDNSRIPSNARQEGRELVLPVKLSGAVMVPVDQSEEALRELKTRSQPVAPASYQPRSVNPSSPSSPASDSRPVTVDGFM